MVCDNVVLKHLKYILNSLLENVTCVKHPFSSLHGDKSRLFTVLSEVQSFQPNATHEEDVWHAVQEYVC